MMPWFLLIGSYFLGGIPFGLLIAKARGVDILAEGSGNIGATNVGRILGKNAYFLTLLLDVLKGAVPGLVAPLIVKGAWGLSVHEFGLLCSLAAVVGHMASPYLKFKGGKGIATGLGVLAGSAPLVALTVLVVWGLTFLASRLVSLASLMATVSMVVAGFVLYRTSWIYLAVFIGLTAFIWIKHIPNIKRILKGEEKKFSFAKVPAEEAGGDDVQIADRVAEEAKP